MDIYGLKYPINIPLIAISHLQEKFPMTFRSDNLGVIPIGASPNRLGAEAAEEDLRDLLGGHPGPAAMGKHPTSNMPGFLF